MSQTTSNTFVISVKPRTQPIAASVAGVSSVTLAILSTLQVADGGPQATLSWSVASNTAGVAATGYTIYIGTVLGNYTRAIDAGIATTYTINSGLTQGTMYYWVVAAYDASFAEGMVSGPQELWCPIKSRTFHVAKTTPGGATSSDSNSGTQALPWQTILKAHNTATLPGDTIIVHTGTYDERIIFAHGGTSENRRITYQAAYGETVNLRCSATVGISLGAWYFSGSGNSSYPGGGPFNYITIDGFHIQGTSSTVNPSGTYQDGYGYFFAMYSGGNSSAQFLTFKNLEISGAGTALFVQSQGVKIWDCNIHNNEMRGVLVNGTGSNDNLDFRRLTASGNNAHGLWSVGNNTDGINVQDADNVLVEDCVAFGANPGQGASPSNPDYQYDGLDQGAAQSAPGMTRMIVRRCLSHDHGNTNFPNSTAITGPVEFQYCRSYACNQGPGWGGCVTYEGSRNVGYWNCTHEDVDSAIAAPQAAGVVRVRNNIFSLRVARIIAMDPAGSPVTTFASNYNHKSTLGAWGAAIGPNDAVGTIGFADPAFQTSRDYRLSPTSVCRDAGTFFMVTTSAGTGVSVIPVDTDPRGYFKPGDQIRVQNATVASGSAASGPSKPGLCFVASTSANSITIYGIISFNTGAGVHLPWEGNAPDKGALEYTIKPDRPTGMRVVNVVVP